MDTLFLAVRVAVSLAAVLGLLWYVQRRITKGPGAQRTAGLVSVVGRQGIGPKASVVVVDVDGARFVLGVTEQSVSVLHSSAQRGAEPAAERPVAVVPVPRDAEFAQVLTDASATEALEPPLAFRPRRGGHPAGRGNKLAGSILSPTTWQQTAAVIRQGR